MWCRQAPITPVNSVYWLALVVGGPGCYDRPGQKCFNGANIALGKNLLSESCQLKGTIPSTLGVLSTLVALRTGTATLCSVSTKSRLLCTDGSETVRSRHSERVFSTRTLSGTIAEAMLPRIDSLV